MTTNQEVAVSFGLFVIGTILVAANFLVVIDMIYWQLAAVGMLIMMTGYLFAIEAVRELEEKDHFLARILERRE